MRFSVAKIPVKVRPEFLLMAAAVGMLVTWSESWAGVRIVALPIVSATVVIGVIIHELGHANEARRAGLSPSITLHLYGGQTQAAVTGTSPWRDMWIAAAGGVYQAAAAGLAWAVWWAWFEQPGLLWQWKFGFITGPSAAIGFALYVFASLNAFWALLNLIPFGGLDGGLVLSSLLKVMKVKRPMTVMLGYRIVAGVVVVGLLAVARWWWLAAYAAVITALGFRHQVRSARFESDVAAFGDLETAKMGRAGQHRAIVDIARRVRGEAKTERYRRWAVQQELLSLACLGDGDGVDVLLAGRDARDLLSNRDIAAAMRELGRFEGAVDYYRRQDGVRALQGDDAFRMLGALIATDRGPEAVDILDVRDGAGCSAIQLSGLHKDLWDRGEHDLALRVRQFIRKSPHGLVPLLLALFDEDKQDDAIASAMRSYKEAPSATTAACRAFALAATGQPQAARELLDEAIAGGADRTDLVNVQILLHRSGAYELAVELSDRILESEDDLRTSGVSLVHYNRACSLARLGRRDDAMRELEAVHALHLARIIDTDEDLDSLRECQDFIDLAERVRSG